MKKQELINAISTLAHTIDSLSRTGNNVAVEQVTLKLLELVKQL